MNAISLGTLGIILLASLGWAGLDTLRKALASKAAPLVVASVVLTTQGLVLALWLLLQGSPSFPEAGYLWPALGVFAIGMLSNWLFVKALATSDLSRTIPLLSLTPVITAIAGIPILGEVPSLQQWTGIVIVVAGALVLNAKGKNPFKGLASEPGALMMAGVAVLWAVAGTIDKRALDYVSPELHGALSGVVVGTALLGLLFVKGQGHELKDVKANPLLFAGAGAVGALALLFQLKAFELADVSIVETIKRAVGLMSAVVLGRLLFGEAVTVKAIVAIALMGLGSGLLVM